MVRVGNHTLQIVDAQTLQPLQEYTDHNHHEIWVEGRPGHEFWLRLISHGRGTRTVASAIEVDGTNIGYRFNHGPDCNLEATLGPIGASSLLLDTTTETGDNNTKSCQAFSFARRTLPQGISSDASATATGGKPSSSLSKSTNHGSVQVTWSEGYESGIPTRKWFRIWNETSLEQRRQQQQSLQQHYSQQETSTTAAPSPDKKEGVGCLQSKLGTSTHRVPKASTSWNLGRPLCTITIRYCEMAGLVARGIVQLPSQVQGPMVVVAGDGNKKRKARTFVETVDLTCDSDNDGEVNDKQKELSKTLLTAPVDLSSATEDYHDETNNDASEASLKEATNATGAVDLTTSDNEEETALSGSESQPEATNNTENKE